MSKLTDAQELLEDALLVDSLRGFLAFVKPIRIRLNELGSDERRRLREKVESMKGRTANGLTADELEVFRDMKEWAAKLEMSEAQKGVLLRAESSWMRRLLGR